jgi:hypothetical protein
MTRALSIRWLNDVLGGAQPGGGRKGIPARVRGVRRSGKYQRPVVEQLEGRTLLATLTAGLNGAGNLMILDTADVVNSLTLQLNAAADSVVISDASEQFAASSITGAALSNGDKTMTIPLTSITGASISIQAGGGDDSLTIDFSLGNFSKSISYDGGTQTTSDSLSLTGGPVDGGSFSSVTHTFMSNSAGTVDVTGNSQISYAGLEPITDNLSATDRVFTFNAGSETITLTDAAGANMTIDSTLGESVTFANPTGSLTINAGTGDDTININSVDAAFGADLTINGDTGSDTVNLNADITFAAGENLAVTAETINTGAGADMIVSGAGAIMLTGDDIALDATSTLVSAGTINLRPQTASRPINLGTETGGSLSLTDTELDRVTADTLQIGDSNSGAITVSAAITQGNNLALTTGAGVTFNNAVTMTADKSLTVSAVGTSNGTISLANTNADLSATGAGAISLTTVRNISLTSGSSITTVDGNLTLAANQQVTPTSGGFIGVRVEAATVSTSGTGVLSLAGRGGDTGNEQIGIELRDVSVVSGGTSGATSLTGAGGASTGSDNHGIQVRGSTVTSAGSNVELIGLGGNSGSGTALGMLRNGAEITSRFIHTNPTRQREPSMVRRVRVPGEVGKLFRARSLLSTLPPRSLPAAAARLC